MKRRQKMIWLFSFADLAFILVLALSLMPQQQNEIAQLKMAQVTKNTSMKRLSVSQNVWRVHITHNLDSEWPILLEEWDAETNKWRPKGYVNDAKSLSDKLVQLKNQQIVPSFSVDKDSQSGDMLQALSLVQNVWPKSEVWTTVTTAKP